MQKNRDYTGLVITPSSMAWLIGQRSRVKGVIDKLRKMLDEGPKALAHHQEDLRVIDAVITLHEVKVDASSIVGTRPKRKNSVPRGNMKRHILNYLRAADQPLYTDDIALHVAKLEKIDLETFPRARFTRLISYRLKDMARKGLVNRHHPKQTSNLGRWTIRAPKGD